MKHVSKILLFLGLIIPVVLCAQDIEDDMIIRLDPEYAGDLQFDNTTDSILFTLEGISTVEVSVDYNAGWMPIDTETVYNEAGIPVELIFHAEPADKSLLSDSLVISEIYFCNKPEDSESDWFEVCNFSLSDVVLENAFIQTSKGKQYFGTAIKIPAQSCVKLLGDDDFDLSWTKDSLVLADENGQIISQFSWDASRMNFPEDSVFSLEIKNVFASEQEISNWDIIYGEGRGGLLPEKYAEHIKSESVWIWLQFVIWGGAALILILLVILSFRKKKRS